MAVIERPSRGHSDTLIVLLPGLKDRARVFEDEGFVALLREAHVAADLALVDAHAGYYAHGTLLRRLHRDVIAPAKRRYRHIVLLGVSLGGYGALRYAMSHPGEISEIVLLSPFLGMGPFLKDLAEAGDEDFAQTWEWLRSGQHPRIVLGYGSGELFFKSDGDLRALLPESDVVTTPGVHVWSTWRALLSTMLERGLVSPASESRPASPDQGRGTMLMR